MSERSGKTRGQLSVQARLMLTVAIASLTIIAVNIVLFFNINRSMEAVNRAYATNLIINELSDSLRSVENSMTDYLNTKSTDAIEQYFGAEQAYREKLEELSDVGTDRESRAMLDDIANLSDSWLEVTSETIRAKRGRVVDRYSVSYERANKLYSYINAYIYSFNSEQFRANSENYMVLLGSFRRLEYITMGVIILVAFINFAVTSLLTKNILDPVTQREIMMETHLKDAELKYLQAQVNPHFLFNTLNAGAQLAMLENADRTSVFIQNMAAFFRYKLKREDKDTTLADEIGLVDNYVYILNVRFSGEILFEKDVDERCLKVPVPGMILQPIVENAVNYGIRNVDHEKRIRLTVRSEGTLIRVIVRDNGVGMSAERIEKVLAGNAGENPVMKDSNGVGLSNVMARMRLFYNTDHVMNITSEGEGRGTTVELLIPAGDGEWT
ncbi:MAG: histidine kinase, partial [Lachnospiraceae bacterium]|nr:histidine kinase [Lachnospiraceae bacterium]